MTHILADNIFKCISLNEKLYILIKISLKFVPKGPIDYNHITIIYHTIYVTISSNRSAVGVTHSY